MTISTNGMMVKRVIIPLLAFVAIVLAQQCFAQHKDGDVLRILAVGNSFSDDGMEYLPALLADIGVKDVELARLYVGGCSLQRHLEFHKKGESPYVFTTSKAGENRWVEQKEKHSLKQALEQGEWDIITLQQQSGLSGIYDSYEPYLSELIEIIKTVQPNAHIAWHMTWSYGTNSTHNNFPRYDRNQQTMTEAIYAATEAACEAHPEIEIIIPAATAIQSLRKSAINNSPMDLTRDGFHMGYGAGRYALACTWYEELIKPYTRISMKGNTLRINKGTVAVTPLVAAYCQKAAKRAVKNNFRSREIKCVGNYLRKAKSRGTDNVIE